MGILDNLTGTTGTKTQNSDILGTVLGMISNNEHGGLGGLIKSFTDKGLGGIVSSWISTGENKPISDDEVRRGVGEERIKEISEKTGKSQDTVVSTLKNHLPDIVDKLTPTGNMPDNNLLQQGIGILKNLF